MEMVSAVLVRRDALSKASFARRGDGIDLHMAFGTVVMVMAAWNAGLTTRSYLYIDDVVEAFDIILHKGILGETYNIGSQRERTVLSVAWDILRMFQLPDSQIVHVRDRAFNDRRYFVCDKKLAALGALLGTATCPHLMLSPLCQKAPG
jgi:nucleoside-diphosphate-sugar epimerase